MITEAIIKGARMGLTEYQIAFVCNIDLLEVLKHQDIIDKNLPENFMDLRIKRFNKAMGYSAKLKNKLKSAIKSHIAQMIVRDMDKDIDNLIGYPTEYLLANFESKFKAGMNWDNWGSKWHIDHIKPRKQYKVSELKECFALNNLQPLSKEENWRKK